MEMEKVTLISSKGDYIYLYSSLRKRMKKEMNGRENIVLGFFFFVFAVKFLTFSTKTRITNYVDLPKSKIVWIQSRAQFPLRWLVVPSPSVQKPFTAKTLLHVDSAIQEETPQIIS